MLAERGYEGTSIERLLARADVGRSTFYAHFRNKDALLDSALLRLEAELRAAPDRDVLPFTRAFLEHVSSQRVLHARLRGSAAGQRVLSRMRRMLVELAIEDLGKRRGSTADDALVAEHAIGSLMALTSHWLAERPDLDAAAIDARYRALVLPTL